MVHIHKFASCFSGHKRMWTSTNYFLVNLSFTDLLMTILNGLFNFIYMRDNDWPFGSVYCTINNFVAYYTVIASVLTLTAITLDRYVNMSFLFTVKFRYYEKATKFENISHLFWQNRCFYSVASKQVGDFLKFLWPFQKSWTLLNFGLLQ